MREEAQITPSMSPVKPRSLFPGPMIARFSPTIERKPRSHTPVQRSISPSILRRSISLLDLAPLDLVARSRLHAISPTTHRSLSVILIFVVVVWWCGSGVLVVVAFDCQSLLPLVELEFRWCVVLGFGCDFEIFCNKICLDAEKIAEKM